ncbi:MAG: ATP-binding cassette domain-containing protein [Candidatus Cloacimonetes bacterium]|nr:ATP-binding cassette domain-containing protein [Candidatus Cloacimonadota bacterium]
MIEVKNLTRWFDTLKAVDNIAFTINEGEIVGFLGPNGAGKTTTLRMLVGYLQPNAGTVKILNKDINDDPIGIAMNIGYLPEHSPLYDDMIVYDYLAFIADIRHMDMQRFRERLDYVIDKCGLRDVIGQQIQTLSKGYRQRTGLAQAILHDPKVLILDEPTSGLDPNQILEIRELIKELGKEKTVILSSHIMQEVQAVCDRIIIINKGRIIADELKDELGKHISEHTVLTVELEANALDFSTWLASHPEAKMTVISNNGNHWKLEFSYPGDLDLQRDLSQFISAKGWLILSMFRQQHSLEEIFHMLTTNDEELAANEDDAEIEVIQEEESTNNE